MEYPELEVSDDSAILKELVSAYKDHIETLKAEVHRLRSKYEPTALELASSQAEKFNPPTTRPRLSTTRQVIHELEKRTLVKAGVVSDEKAVTS